MLLAHFVGDAGQSDMVRGRFGGINRRTALQPRGCFLNLQSIGALKQKGRA
jgi:hypothetical protein